MLWDRLRQVTQRARVECPRHCITERPLSDAVRVPLYDRPGREAAGTLLP